MAKYWWSLVQFDAKTLTCPRERAIIVGAAFGSVGRRQLATLKKKGLKVHHAMHELSIEFF
jgi:hypothetical protein